MTNGYNLRKIRQLKGLSQLEIASQIGTTQPQYNKYETGKQDPSARVIIALSKIYNVSADEILGLCPPYTLPEGGGK
jgi:transcriptional regulator with XRE-family HTH domain